MAEVKWILCEDRLPEKDGNYLTLCRNEVYGYLYNLVEVSFVADDNGGWNCSRDADTGIIDNGHRFDVFVWADSSELYEEAERMVKG